MKNKSMLYYKGYRTKPEYSADDNIFYGTIMGISDMIYFQSDTAQELEKEFRDSVDDYLEFCKEMGKEPQREFSGIFSVHIPPELHMEISAFAQEEGVTLNKAVEQAIRALVQT